MTARGAPEYLDFEIQIDPKEERKGYPISARGPAGNAVRDLFVIDEEELRSHRLQIEEAILRRGPTRRVSSEIQLAQTVGAKLFDALPQLIKENYWRSLSMVEQTGKGLRFKLRIDPRATGLLGLPWELLYDSERGDFLARRRRTPLVRYIPLPGSPRPLQVQPPLRILILIASPEDRPVPGLQEERRRIYKVLSPLKREQQVDFEIIEGPDTFAQLRAYLRRTEFHALHFIGHGGFDESAEEGVLLFEDSKGVSRSVTGDQIKAIIGDATSVRLVFLNACEGAQLAMTDAFTGVAMGLVRAGIPAVVAMQFEITGGAAVWFSSEFYKALADGYPVDAAVSEGRKAIYSEMGSVEWATPVLYMRASDGLIFELAPRETASRPRSEVDARIKQTRPVRFVFQDAEAGYVHIAGSFNGWLNAVTGRIRQSSQYELRQTAPGQWEITLNLLPGTYEYKFVVDGRYWHPDPNAAQGAPDGYGGQNSVVVVD